MKFPTRTESLSGLTEYLAAVATECRLSDRTLGIFRLVLEELMTNSITHGRAPPSAPIEVSIEVAGDDTVLSYSDAGFPFDPRCDLPPESRFDDLENRPIGKLGWPLILHYFSLEEYTFAKGRNRLVLKLDLSR